MYSSRSLLLRTLITVSHLEYKAKLEAAGAERGADMERVGAWPGGLIGLIGVDTPVFLVFLGAGSWPVEVVLALEMLASTGRSAGVRGGMTGFSDRTAWCGSGPIELADARTPTDGVGARVSAVGGARAGKPIRSEAWRSGAPAAVVTRTSVWWMRFSPAKVVDGLVLPMKERRAAAALALSVCDMRLTRRG